EPAQDLRRPLVELGPRLPAQLHGGAARVEGGAGELSGPGGRISRRAGNAGGGRHGAVELVDGRLDAGADVDQQPVTLGGRPGEGVDDVVDIDEVPRLLAVPVDRALLAGQQQAGEDGDDASLAVGVLAGAVHVRQGQDSELHAVQVPVGGQV